MKDKYFVYKFITGFNNNVKLMCTNFIPSVLTLCASCKVHKMLERSE